jgi:hypothetical protein
LSAFLFNQIKDYQHLPAVDPVCIHSNAHLEQYIIASPVTPYPSPETHPHLKNSFSHVRKRRTERKNGKKKKGKKLKKMKKK